VDRHAKRRDYDDPGARFEVAPTFVTLSSSDNGGQPAYRRVADRLACIGL